MVHQIDSCPKFGWNFHKQHPMCKICKRAQECVKLSKQDDKMKRKMGQKPKIPYAQCKREPPVHILSPTIQDHKWIQITMKFDLEWLRKHIPPEGEAES